MTKIIDDFKNEFDSIIKFCEKDLATLRTGRANPVMVEDIQVEAYGVKTPIKHLASISVPAARILSVEPWDKTILKDIEKGINAANIGLNPVNEGRLLRITLPALTSESRQELIKHVGQKVEQSKIKIRMLRDKIRDKIIESFNAKEISEDEKFFLLKKLDDQTKEYNEKIKSVADAKENEIMTI